MENDMMNGTDEAVSFIGNRQLHSSGDEDDIISGLADPMADALPIVSDGRIKKKARRLHAAKEGRTAANNLKAASVTVARPFKNNRKPRNGYGRGLPKKGGAGGKGTWGKPGSELLDEDFNENPGDPNYDSDSQDNYVITALRPKLSEDEIQKYVEPLLQEYFEHGETEEVIVSLFDVNFGENKCHIPLIAVSLAMDRKPSQRELTSVLISDLYPRVLSQTDIAKGFEILLRNLPDIVLDTPDAPVVLGNFIARAVADDCLPPKILLQYKAQVEGEYARAAVERADVLLSMKHGLVRLDNVWGVGGGTRPVKYLIKKMVLLLKEYLSSGDSVEAMRCLNELEVPHFHHELVYEAIVMVLEDLSERTAELVGKLLKSMYAAVVITPEQMVNGFERVYSEMPEICIDVPLAYTALERFVLKCHEEGFVTDAVVKKMPARGRKRFVSEGDGGRVKENASS